MHDRDDPKVVGHFQKNDGIGKIFAEEPAGGGSNLRKRFGSTQISRNNRSIS